MVYSITFERSPRFYAWLNPKNFIFLRRLVPTPDGHFRTVLQAHQQYQEHHGPFFYMQGNNGQFSGILSLKDQAKTSNIVLVD